MQVTIVHVEVKAEYVNDFIEACRLNHEASIQEDGNFRFDVLQMLDNPSKFVLYEAYKTPDDAVTHKATSHYLTWRDTVSDWMAKPRQGVTYSGLYPREP